MTISAFPPAPSRADPSIFADKADAFLGHLESPFVAEINALEANVNAKEASAVAAAATATNAITSINTALNRYTLSTSTTMSDPVTGAVRFNHASFSLVTAIAISDNTADLGNPNIRNILINMGSSASAVKGQIRFTRAGASASYLAYNVASVVANAGWVQLMVTHIQSAGSFNTAPAGLIMEFHRTGDPGDVTLGTAQTITGQKTFTQPIVGSITGNAGTVTNGLYTTGDQTKTGVLTFSSSPVVPTPSLGTHAANRGYVDTAVAAAAAAAVAAAPMIGVGQTWQNVTTSRSLGTNYTNTTGKPIVVSVVVNGSTAYCTLYVGTLFLVANVNAQAISGGSDTVSMIVPHGSVYMVTASGVQAWNELR